MSLRHDIIQGDCMEVLKTLPGNSVDLIATDPPYFRVKGEAWDNQWANPAKFLEWIDALCEQWKRVLRPNGSLYVFASPQMSHGVEGVIRKHFNVLNNIRWQKEAGWHNKARKEDLRSFLSPWEACIYAEHFGCEYEAAAKALHKQVYASIGRQIQLKRESAGLQRHEIDTLCSPSRKPTGLCYRWEAGDCLPTAEQYAAICEATGHHMPAYEDLRLQYEALRPVYEAQRQQYESLRRPFAVTAEVPTADIWNFPAVQPYPGKHVCEKPAALMEHIIRSSSCPGAVVLDCFMGSNATGKAARKLGRAYIGIELDPHWIAKARPAVAPAPATWQAMQRPCAALPRPFVPVAPRQPHMQPPVFAQLSLFDPKA